MKFVGGMCVLLILQCQNGEYVCSNDVQVDHNSSVEKTKDTVGSKTGKRSSTMIDETLNLLHQDDPLLIDILRHKYLIPPSDLPYNFSSANPKVDGQYKQPLYIKNTFYSVSIMHIKYFLTLQLCINQIPFSAFITNIMSTIFRITTRSWVAFLWRLVPLMERSCPTH